MVDILERGGRSPVQGYLHRLETATPGHGRLRADLLAEVAGGLEEETGALVATGRSRRDAEHEAVARFGPVAVVARECGREVIAHASRRLAIGFGLLLPATMAAWKAVWIMIPATAFAGAPTLEPAWYALLSRGVDWMQLVGASVALVAGVVLSRGSLKQRRPELVSGLLLGWVLFCLALTEAGGVLLSAGTSGWYDWSSGIGAISAVGLTTAVANAVVCLVAVRCLADLRRMRRLRT